MNHDFHSFQSRISSISDATKCLKLYNIANCKRCTITSWCRRIPCLDFYFILIYFQTFSLQWSFKAQRNLVNSSASHHRVLWNFIPILLVQNEANIQGRIESCDVVWISIGAIIRRFSYFQKHMKNVQMQKNQILTISKGMLETGLSLWIDASG